MGEYSSYGDSTLQSTSVPVIDLYGRPAPGSDGGG